MDTDLLKVLSLAGWPLLTVLLCLAVWKIAYVRRRPLSRAVKLIVVGIVLWSSLPLLLPAALWGIAATGGNLGD